MNSEDFQAISQIAQALWAHPIKADRNVKETITAVSLLHMSSDMAFERAVKALLKRADREGSKTNSLALDMPYYRLSPKERLILCALHNKICSYKRLSQILGEAPENISSSAWNARLRLQSTAPHPAGPDEQMKSCPHYDPKDPWTQRFLDNELPRTEKFRLESHLVKCEHCKRALIRCRAYYYNVESMLPRFSETKKDLIAFAKTIHQVRVQLNPSENSFMESMNVFLRRKEILIIFGGLLAFFALELFK